jgi:hypothetical protein
MHRPPCTAHAQCAVDEVASVLALQATASPPTKWSASARQGKKNDRRFDHEREDKLAAPSTKHTAGLSRRSGPAGGRECPSQNMACHGCASPERTGTPFRLCFESESIVFRRSIDRNYRRLCLKQCPNTPVSSNIGSRGRVGSPTFSRFTRASDCT